MSRSIDQARRPPAEHAPMLALLLLCLLVFAGCGDDPAPTVGARSEAFTESTRSPVEVVAESARYRAEAFAELTVVRDLQYGESPDLLLDLYAPAGDTVTMRPALIWLHGGGFSAGNRSEGPLIAFPTTFAKLGYVSVSIDYRLLSSEQCIAGRVDTDECTAAAAAATSDAQAAVRWVRANAAAYGIDTARIAIAGESAGAIAATGVGIGSTAPEESVRAWVSISGGVGDTGAVDRNDAPGCLISGTADGFIPYQWSADTAAALRAAGVPVVLETLEGANHVPVADYGEFLVSRSRDFLYDQLDLAHAAK